MKYFLTIISIIVISQFLYADDIYFKSGYIFKNVIVKDTIDRRINVLIDDSLRSFPLSTVYHIVKREYDPTNKMVVENFSPPQIMNDLSEKNTIGKIIEGQKEQERIKSIQQKNTEYKDEMRDTLNLRISIAAGYSYRVAIRSDNIPSDFKDYVARLKSGLNIAANISYYLGAKFGLCLNYNHFTTSNSIQGVYLYDLSTGAIRGPGEMIDDITISYIGLGFAVRSIFSNGNILLIANLSIGYGSYDNEGKLIDPIQIEGSGFGISGLLNLDFMISRNWALGLGISYLRDGGVRTVSANTDEEDLFRLDFNAGVRYYY